MSYSKVKDDENLIRDENTRAILNTDKEGLRAYRAQKAKYKEMDNMKNDIDNIKGEMSEIKSMLKSLLEK
ncbi:hypothetical protein [Methanohalobium sp.]|uniref:hypothetical protein n=1 Tax=Methanohalobium sp. TaxID=2837493 RepID=UPI0025D429DC|nr:hypothetical protein [Methanohalobium sp.]